MAEISAESSENQASDNEFEKVQFPGDEDAKEDETEKLDHSLKHPGSSSVDSERFEGQNAETTAKNLAPEASEQEQRDAKCFWLTALDPKVQDLIYWQDVRKTALVFVSSLVILSLLALFSLLSIFAYASLFLLTFTFAYRLYGNAIGYIKKSQHIHPLNKYLEKEISFPAESIHKAADQLVKSVSKVTDDLRRLFLVEKFLDSVKFALLLWLMTFIGTWLNGISFVLIADVVLFTVPKFYRVYQKQIDEFLCMANAKMETVIKAVQQKIQRKKKE